MVTWLKQFISEWKAVLIAVLVVSAVGSFILFSVVFDAIVEGIHNRQAHVYRDRNIAYGYHVEKLKGVDNFEDYWHWCSRKQSCA